MILFIIFISTILWFIVFTIMDYSIFDILYWTGITLLVPVILLFVMLVIPVALIIDDNARDKFGKSISKHGRLNDKTTEE